MEKTESQRSELSKVLIYGSGALALLGALYMIRRYRISLKPDKKDGSEKEKKSPKIYEIESITTNVSFVKTSSITNQNFTLRSNKSSNKKVDKCSQHGRVNTEVTFNPNKAIEGSSHNQESISHLDKLVSKQYESDKSFGSGKRSLKLLKEKIKLKTATALSSSNRGEQTAHLIDPFNLNPTVGALNLAGLVQSNEDQVPTFRNEYNVVEEEKETLVNQTDLKKDTDTKQSNLSSAVKKIGGYQNNQSNLNSSIIASSKLDFLNKSWNDLEANYKQNQLNFSISIDKISKIADQKSQFNSDDEEVKGLYFKKSAIFPNDHDLHDKSKHLSEKDLIKVIKSLHQKDISSAITGQINELATKEIELDQEGQKIKLSVLWADQLILILNYIYDNLHPGLSEIVLMYTEERRKMINKSSSINDLLNSGSRYFQIVLGFLKKKEEFFLCVIYEVLVRLNLKKELLDNSFTYYMNTDLNLSSEDIEQLRLIRESYNRVYEADKIPKYNDPQKKLELSKENVIQILQVSIQYYQELLALNKSLDNEVAQVVISDMIFLKSNFELQHIKIYASDLISHDNNGEIQQLLEQIDGFESLNEHNSSIIY